MSSSMSSWLYLEADLICIFILAIMRISLSRHTIKMPDDRLFRNVVDGVLGMLAADAVWAFIDGRMFWGARILNCLASGVYLFFTGAISLLWLLYTHYRLYENMAAIRRRLPYYCIPAALLLILCIASCKTGWIYSVDQTNTYHRGPYHFAQIAIGVTYLVMAVFLTARGALTGNVRASKRECRLLIAFSLLVVMGGLAQILVFQVPVALAGVVIALLSVFINIQNKGAAQDELTQISDRSRLRRYITGLISASPSKEGLYLLLLDIDDFTGFNIKFGHLAGNEMLKYVSKTLLEVCAGRGGFVARYGGDEFAVVLDAADPQEISRLLDEIRTALAAFCERECLPQTLTLSSGIAAYDSAQMTGADMLCAAAEQQLRLQKAAARQAPSI